MLLTDDLSLDHGGLHIVFITGKETVPENYLTYMKYQHVQRSTFTAVHFHNTQLGS